MARCPLSRSAAPVVRRLHEVLENLGIGATDADDPTFYSALLMAVRTVADGGQADPDAHRSGPDLDAADEVVRRLSAGWFRDPDPYVPQSRFTTGPAEDVRRFPTAVSSTFVGGADKPSGAFWTSSFLPDGSSAWAGVEEVTGSGGTRGLWEVHVDLDGTRLLTIDGNDDYVGLVLRHPLPRGDRLTVDWESVATEFDAVHLTAAGLADTHGAIRLHDGRVIALRGWDGESTAWLGFPNGRPQIRPRAPSS